MAWVSEKNKDIIPYTTDENGNYDDRSAEDKQWNHDDGLNWWTNGFWGGIMWLLYQDTQEEKYALIARVSEQKMEKCFESYFGLHHDVGFMFLPTAVADYRLTGHEDSKRIAMHAANLLAGRINPEGKFIRAWNQVPGSDTRGWAIIDCMFNICLLYWASEESADPRFRQIAMMHADTVMENFIRPDGSVCHIVEFDPETGVMVKSHGGQGYAEGSSWTRGQAWAIYGFALSYRHTKQEKYLDTARKVCFGDISLDSLHDMTYKAARKELLGLYGVGEKVADCICLFGLHQLDAFPVDTHIRQALDAHYKRGFPNRRYKGCRGVMQQYIFYYELMK